MTISNNNKWQPSSLYDIDKIEGIAPPLHSFTYEKPDRQGQIYILYLIINRLNFWSPLINQSKMLVNQTLVKILPFPQVCELWPSLSMSQLAANPSSAASLPQETGFLSHPFIPRPHIQFFLVLFMHFYKRKILLTHKTSTDLMITGFSPLQQSFSSNCNNFQMESFLIKSRFVFHLVSQKDNNKTACFI